jgi:hypothetical protein
MSDSCTTNNTTSVRVENVSERGCPTVHYEIQSNFLAASDLPFPIFGNVSENNATLHLKMPDDILSSSRTPPLQLAYATRYLEGAM